MAAKKTTVPAKKAAKKVAKKGAREKQIRFPSVAALRGFIQEEVEKDSYRMVPKEQAVAAPAPEAEPDAPDAALATWGPKPAVSRQLELHPTSVRYKAVVTRQFVLADEKSLADWNKLQARMHPPEAPQVRLAAYTCEFCQSIQSYVILVSHSEIEYQQI